jgi:tRNA(Ile)-lysidine synthase
MSQAKKLQDFMVDSKIRRSWRDRVPLIVSEGGIAWVAGWRVAEWAKATAASRRVLELRLTPRRA